MVQVAGVDIDERFDALIGMDIIGLGADGVHDSIWKEV